jgi:hypothetical protein
MAMSENDFYLLKGNSYRGSRYGNFAGGGTDPQGNVSSAATENASNTVGTSGPTDQPSSQQPTSVSEGLSDVGALPSATNAILGVAAPYAGNAIGQAAGSAIGAGAGAGEALSYGAKSLASKVSGGLIGSAASPTNAALSGMAGAGPATQSAVKAASAASNVGKLGSGANLGGAAGAGIASAAITLLTTGNAKEAVKSGAGTAAGTAIGSAIGSTVPVIGTVIGGYVGGFIGGLLCFAAGTPILLEDGSRKAVEDLKLGDVLLAGGRVLGRGEGYSDDLFRYKNTRLSGAHAVFEEGRWTRVHFSDYSEEIDLGGEHVIVYPLATENHLVVTPWFISADIYEVMDTDDEAYTEDQRLCLMNGNTVRNAELLVIEKEVCHGV